MKSIIYSLGILLIVFGCNRSTEVIGPETKGASSNFMIVETFKADKNSVKFYDTESKNHDSISFTAKFNEEVSYKIIITGEESGAKKEISGVGEEINEKWDGSSEMIFFKDEKCEAKLIIPGYNNEELIEVEINAIYNPAGNENIIFIADMEPIENGGKPAACGFFEPKMKKFCGTSSDYGAIQGDYSMIMEGIDSIGGKYIGLSLTKGTGDKGNYIIPTNNPDSLWFTVFVYGFGDENAQMYVKIMQNDDGTTNMTDPLATKEPHDGKSENGFEIQILDLSHYGWKAFSYNYGALSLGGNDEYGGNGDGIHRPKNICQIEYAIWSNKRNVPVKIVYDYPVFTIGKPFGK